MSRFGKYFVALPENGMDPRIRDIVNLERPRCLVFLSEGNLLATVPCVYADLVDPYEGIFPVDEAGIEAVQASLRRSPAPEPRPLLVVSALDRADAKAVIKAASKTFAVVNSHQFSYHNKDGGTVQRVREWFPNARFLVMIENGSNPQVQAVHIDQTTATTIYDTTWQDDETAAGIGELIKVLARESTRTPPGS